MELWNGYDTINCGKPLLIKSFLLQLQVAWILTLSLISNNLPLLITESLQHTRSCTTRFQPIYVYQCLAFIQPLLSVQNLFIHSPCSFCVLNLYFPIPFSFLPLKSLVMWFRCCFFVCIIKALSSSSNPHPHIFFIFYKQFWHIYNVDVLEILL